MRLLRANQQCVAWLVGWSVGAWEEMRMAALEGQPRRGVTSPHPGRLASASLARKHVNCGTSSRQVVGDLMRGPDTGSTRTASAAELQDYIRHPPTIGGRAVPVRNSTLADSLRKCHAASTLVF